MAYSASVSVTTKVISGRRHFIVDVVETEAAAASEYSVPSYDLPTVGKVVQHKSTLISGTGTTINPKAGLSTGWSASTQAALYANSVAAAHVNIAPTTVSGHFTQSGGMFVQSVVNAGADNVIHTQIVIVEGLN